MDQGISGKVALVAASSPGLGKAVASALECEGAQVAICVRNTASVEAAKKAIRRQTVGEAQAFQADLARPGQVRSLSARCKEFTNNRLRI